MEFDIDKIKISERNLFMLHEDTDWSQVDINELHRKLNLFHERTYFNNSVRFPVTNWYSISKGLNACSNELSFY